MLNGNSGDTLEIASLPVSSLDVNILLSHTSPLPFQGRGDVWGELDILYLGDKYDH